MGDLALREELSGDNQDGSRRSEMEPEPDWNIKIVRLAAAEWFDPSGERPGILPRRIFNGSRSVGFNRALSHDSAFEVERVHGKIIPHRRQRFVDVFRLAGARRCGFNRRYRLVRG